MFDDEFIENLPEDSVIALQEIKRHFQEFNGQLQLNGENYLDGDTYSNYSALVEAYSFLVAYLEKIKFPEVLPEIYFSDRQRNIELILRAFYEDINEYIGILHDTLNKNLFVDSKSRFVAKLGAGFAYEFSEGDLEKVQSSINELRDLISASEIIEDNHKQRLLKRLERLQSELHKKMSDLDRFWGFVGDAGVVMRKLGKDAKPVTDRIKEIMETVWNTQARAEELESGTPNPFLKQNNDSEE
jgi:hypothetical protein